MQSKRDGARLVFVLLALFSVVLASCGSDEETDNGAKTTEPSESGGSGDILGTPNAAKGEAVKIGIVSSSGSTGGNIANQDFDGPIAKAVAGWMNEYTGGIGGRPVEIQVCNDKGEAAAAVACANDLIRANVMAVIYGATGNFEASWKPLHDAGIPTFIQATSAKAATLDTTTTFMFNNTKASTLLGPIGLAKKAKTTKISGLIIDVPAATQSFTDPSGKKIFADAGVTFDLVPVAFGTPDMTVQTQGLVKKNPDGVVLMLGDDTFCIAGLKGLHTAGFKGSITANEACVSTNTVKAVGGDLVKDIKVVTQVPFADTDNESTKFYNAVVKKYAPDFDLTDEQKVQQTGFIFLVMTGLDAATADLKGDVTSQSIIAAAKSMKWTEQKGSGGRHIRCNSKADPAQPAVCSNAVLFGLLGTDGRPVSFEKVGDEKVAD